MAQLLRSSGRLTALLLLSASSLGAGCTCDAPPSRPPLDAGPRDTPPRIDMGPIDAPGTDGAVDDAPGSDGGIDVTACRQQLPDDLMVVDTDGTARDRIVAVAAAHSEWAIAYARAETAVPNVFWALVPTSTDGTAAMAVTTGFSVSDEPAIARTADGWLLTWMSNSTGTYEIFGRGFGADTRPLAAASQLTMNAERDEAPALVRIGTEVLATWIESTVTTRELRARRLGPTGAPAAAAIAIDASPHVPSFPVLSTRLDGAALVFGSSDAVLIALDALGARSTPPAVLSTEGNVASSADVALDASGGAIVFDVLVDGVRPEVRGRLLDVAGTALGPERVLTLSPDTGNGASITAFAGGYALAYRALEASPPVVRVLFLDANLDEVNRLDLGAATRGTRTTIRASGDGRLLVAWADNDLTMTTIRAARIRCQ